MARVINLPESIDLRKYAGNIDSQLNINSCIANRDTSALEILLNRSGIVVELARMYHYYWLRAITGRQNIDEGGNERASWQALRDMGVMPEAEYPYDHTRLFVRPSDTEIARAQSYLRVLECTDIEGGCGEPQLIEGMKLWLAKGFPICGAWNVHPDFGQLNAATLEETQALVSKNYLSRTNRETSHAMLIVGYTKDGFILENSWGSGWGCGGYFLAPFDWLWAFNDGTFKVFSKLSIPLAPDLFVPQYEGKKPKPIVPVRPKEREVAPNGKKHTMVCTLRRWVQTRFGKNMTCGCGALK